MGEGVTDLAFNVAIHTSGVQSRAVDFQTYPSRITGVQLYACFWLYACFCRFFCNNYMFDMREGIGTSKSKTSSFSPKPSFSTYHPSIASKRSIGPKIAAQQRLLAVNARITVRNNRVVGFFMIKPGDPLTESNTNYVVMMFGDLFKAGKIGDYPPGQFRFEAEYRSSRPIDLERDSIKIAFLFGFIENYDVLSMVRDNPENIALRQSISASKRYTATVKRMFDAAVRQVIASEFTSNTPIWGGKSRPRCH